MSYYIHMHVKTKCDSLFCYVFQLAGMHNMAAMASVLDVGTYVYVTNVILYKCYFVFFLMLYLC